MPGETRQVPCFTRVRPDSHTVAIHFSTCCSEPCEFALKEERIEAFFRLRRCCVSEMHLTEGWLVAQTCVVLNLIYLKIVTRKAQCVCQD